MVIIIKSYLWNVTFSQNEGEKRGSVEVPDVMQSQQMAWVAATRHKTGIYT